MRNTPSTGDSCSYDRPKKPHIERGEFERPIGKSARKARQKAGTKVSCYVYGVNVNAKMTASETMSDSRRLSLFLRVLSCGARNGLIRQIVDGRIHQAHQVLPIHTDQFAMAARCECDLLVGSEIRIGKDRHAV